VRVRVLYFAALRERAAGAAGEESIAPGTTVGALWETIRSRPAFRESGTRPGFAVNGEWSEPSRILRDGDEVGFLPPVSGG
jgi:molybdopterin converting factor subunit 1